MNKLDEENKELNKKRRIPLERKFMCKKINDILYGYLQSVATFNPNTNTLYVKKDDVIGILRKFVGVDEEDLNTKFEEFISKHHSKMNVKQMNIMNLIN